ncbi:MAG: hypothetical protein J6B74_07685 [Ruminococcus sp.]|nr:hypothetical protein [Ruminococcus sp.]
MSAQNIPTENPEELAELIDKLMSQGNGHVNIDVIENGKGFRVDTVNSRDCGKQGACMQPTELETDDED